MATISRRHAKAHTLFVLRVTLMLNHALLALFLNHHRPNANIKINADNNKVAMVQMSAGKFFLFIPYFHN
jgi:hypothetical protein